MGYAQNDSGSVFRNNRKREGKKDADFAGSATVGGVEYWVDMWTKPPKDGKKGFFSLSFRAKTPRGEQQPHTQRPGRPQPPTAQRQRPAGLPTRPPARPPVDPDAGIDENSPDLM